VVQVITPGTAVDEYYLDRGSSNYLASLALTDRLLSFAYIDLSTGDFHATSFPVEGGTDQFRQELERLPIKEMILQESIPADLPPLAEIIAGHPDIAVNQWASWRFDIERSRKRLEKQFRTSNLKGFGLDSKSPELLSAGALLHYLDITAKSLIPHVRSIGIYQDTEYLGIDESTQRNLELLRNIREGDARFSLMESLDETRTSMGRRLLKRRLLHPLRNIERIDRRLAMIKRIYQDHKRLALFREFLGRTPDLERLNSRLAMDRAHGSDMALIKNALGLLGSIEELGAGRAFSFEHPDAAALGTEGLERLESLRNLLENALCDEPSMALNEGNLIKKGYNQELDSLKRLQEESRFILEQYLADERTRTGIPNLKLMHNQIIGYFFEVTKTHLAKVPPDFIKRRGTTDRERFTTDRLLNIEIEIHTASEKAIELERELFLKLREKAQEIIFELGAAAKRIAELDVAQSLAHAAILHNWVRPVVDDKNRLAVIDGRHPVVEAHLPSGEFIPNDIFLDSDGISFVMITGPNMAGKSTYLRQTALITIMAQMGSFVPAQQAEIGIADRIYCRVGASDNLARGESTFLVEMNETAYILNTATKRSLVIMDEVGRGTGIIDGLSLAWAVSEELLDGISCRTLFATHFHELSLLTHPRLANRSMEVLDGDGKIVFLRKLREGPSQKSYGIQVARLAGLDERVLWRAHTIMKELEERDKSFRHILTAMTGHSAEPAGDEGREEPAPQRGWFDPFKFERFIDDLFALNLERTTPLEALNLINTWRALFSGHGALGTGRRSGRSQGNKAPSLFD
jgi:DNA mismatch repair protein MutS